MEFSFMNMSSKYACTTSKGVGAPGVALQTYKLTARLVMIFDQLCYVMIMTSMLTY